MIISACVRAAIERRLKSKWRWKLERGLAEGYVANDSLGDQIQKEFEFLDAEQANDPQALFCAWPPTRR